MAIGKLSRNELIKMALNKRCFLKSAIGLACSIGGCTERRASLRDVLSLAQGQLVDRTRADVNVDDLLSSTSSRYVTISFGYIGCGGGVPKSRRILAAVSGVADDRALHLVFDAVDAPHRYLQVMRDIVGTEHPSSDPSMFNILFVKRDALWAQQNNKTVCNMLHAMNVPFEESSYLQTIDHLFLFNKRGELIRTWTGRRPYPKTV